MGHSEQRREARKLSGNGLQGMASVAIVVGLTNGARRDRARLYVPVGATYVTPLVIPIR